MTTAMERPYAVDIPDAGGNPVKRIVAGSSNSCFCGDGALTFFEKEDIKLQPKKAMENNIKIPHRSEICSYESKK